VKEFVAVTGDSVLAPFWLTVLIRKD